MKIPPPTGASHQWPNPPSESFEIPVRQTGSVPADPAPPVAAAEASTRKRLYEQLQTDREAFGTTGPSQAKHPKTGGDAPGMGGGIPEADGILAHFPEQKQRYQALLDRGWKIQWAESEERGTNCSTAQRRIVIIPSLRWIPASLIVALAHEMAHAVFSMEIRGMRYDAVTRQGWKYQSEEEYQFLEKMSEGHSSLWELRLLDEIRDDDVRAYILAELRGKIRAQERFQIHERWQHAVRTANTDEERLRAEHNAMAALGDIYADLRPSGYPDGVKYKDIWRTHYRRLHGDDRDTALLARLAAQTPAVLLPNLAGTSSLPSRDNVEVVHLLPRQSRTNEAKIICVSKDLFLKSLDGLSSSAAKRIVEHALHYGELQFKKGRSKATQNAVFTYTQQKKSYVVSLTFDAAGVVTALSRHTEETRPSTLPLLAPAVNRAMTDFNVLLEQGLSRNQGRIMLPTILQQRGHTCKVTAVANIDNYFADLLQLPNVPAYKNRSNRSDTQLNSYSTRSAASDSYRRAFKGLGSVQGEVLQRDTFETGATSMGLRIRKNLSPRGMEDFLAEVETALRAGYPLLAFFAVSLGTDDDAAEGHPSLRHPEHEHACVITGHDKRRRTLDIAHSGRRFTVSASDFYKSMNILPETREAEFYKAQQYASRMDIASRPRMSVAQKYALVRNAPRLIGKNLEHEHLLRRSVTPAVGSGFKNRVYVFEPEIAAFSTRAQTLRRAA